MVGRDFLHGMKELLAHAKKIVVVSHKNPDGDAIGSSLAMYHYLKQKGNQVAVVMPNNYPDFLKWMPSHEVILNFEAQALDAQRAIHEAEIIFTLDFNDLSRFGKMESVLKKSKATFVMIDHHEKPEKYATYTYSDVSIGSTCEMVYRFIEMMQDGDLIDPQTATCIYVGMMTDSGSFCFPKTTAETHRIVANLIEKGADNVDIHNQVYDQNSFERMRLVGCAINNMRILPTHRTVFTSLTREELQAHNYKKGDTEGVVNFGLSIKGIKFAAFFTESFEETGIIKISFRSKGSFDVNAFARENFGGGGHRNASGAAVSDTLENTLNKFCACLEKIYELNES